MDTQMDPYVNQYPPQQQYAPQESSLIGGSLEGSARTGFIRKVYSILSTQLVITALIVCIVFASDDFNIWLRQNPWILAVSGVLTIGILYTLGCYPSVARSVPINYILLGVFTLAESLLVAAISSQYDAATVLIAAVLTAAVVVGLTLYAFHTKSDVTMCGGVLFVLVLLLLAASILGIFIRNRWLQLAICAGGALLFSFYIVYDTQLILGNKSRSLSIDDYIWAAMMLYIDIVQLFLYILQLLGNRD